MSKRYDLPIFYLFIATLICLAVAISAGVEDEQKNEMERRSKFLNVFQIVEFPNAPCIGSNSRNGTCYTPAQCEARGGTNAGRCAEDFGVCCVFTLGCGERSSENCTYFVSSGSESGACSATICSIRDVDICQLRLDFQTFVISPPSSSDQNATLLLNGSPAVGSGALATLGTRCLDDTFAIDNFDSVLCGILTGDHLYVEVDDVCSDLSFQLGSTSFNRNWNIKVTQIGCNDANKAPEGCDQYFFGADSGTVQSFNFNNGDGAHLANQDQNICVRREAGTCRICWSAVNAEDFMLSGNASEAIGFANDNCCGYGQMGTDTEGYDCVMIAEASTEANGDLLAPTAFCGRSAGLVSVDNGTSTTICSRKTPFSLRFLSDNFEFAPEAQAVDAGFRLAYTLDNDNC